MFDQSGGAQSERVYMKQFIQKFLGETPESEDLFNTEEKLMYICLSDFCVPPEKQSIQLHFVFYDHD